MLIIEVNICIGVNALKDELDVREGSFLFRDSDVCFEGGIAI